MDTSAQLDRFLAGVEKRAYAMVLSSVKNPDDALDIVQDVMIALVTKYAHKPEDQWAPLFYRMLKNRTTDHHRGGAIHQRVFAWFKSDPEDGEDPLTQVAGPAVEQPQDRFSQTLAADEIVQAVAELPERQREAFIYRAWEGLDVKDTSKVMGCSQGSVKTHYSRAVHALREVLAEFGNE
ncbi:MAG: RNA polymerase sigma factor [Pseudomonadales bacterium]